MGVFLSFFLFCFGFFFGGGGGSGSGGGGKIMFRIFVSPPVGP